ncbi:HET-domain-containing protein [Pyrenochaeta sp. DS3sAY3a]|nr:HET-domain-containing protein [Pyrenochaeta sp. DS3sAY3a]
MSSTPPSSLCGGLKDYFEKKERRHDPDFYIQPASVSKSVDCGCRYCLIACHAIGTPRAESNLAKNIEASLGNSSLRYEHEGVPQNSNKSKGDSLDTTFSSSGVVFKGAGVSTEVFVLNENNDPFIPVSVSIPGYTGADESLQAAMKWFAECIKEHRLFCPAPNSSAGPAPLPLRVIDVGLSGTQRIRLKQTNNERGYYACLSHCWGAGQPLRTTLNPDTLTSYQEEIQWGQLPKTFQDAIFVTRKFSIPYLWIDSLCIVQDDIKDWETQSAQMAAIYENSVITFAGSASSGPTQGLFRKADPEHLDHGIGGTEDRQSFQALRKRKPLPHTATELPLMKRAWVFQERLLSTRYLHFGQNELLWECMERQTCECGNLGLGGPSRLTWLLPKHRLHPLSLQHMTIDYTSNVAVAWQVAVVDYTRMELSYSIDIFPAISGIANSVASAMGWTYIAGLWKEHLILDLLWSVDRPNHSRRCDPWRAPTFSWASVTPKEGKYSCINYSIVQMLGAFEKHDPPKSKLDIYVSVVDTHCVPLGHNPTGRLISGCIILQGTLIRSRLRCIDSLRGEWDIAPFGKEVTMDILMTENFVVDADYDYHHATSQLRDGDTVYCLKLVGYTEIPAVRGELLRYLMLRKVERDCELLEGSQGVEEYERIGIMREQRHYQAVKLMDLATEEDIQRDLMVNII